MGSVNYPVAGKPENWFGFRNKLVVEIDFSLAAWNTVGTHEVFAITSPVVYRVYYYITQSVTSGGAATIQFGVQSDTTYYAPNQTYANLVANRAMRNGTTGATRFIQHRSEYVDTGGEVAVFDNSDAGYEILTAALTGGTIRAICYWTALDNGGLVVAGSGGSL